MDVIDALKIVVEQAKARGLPGKVASHDDVERAITITDIIVAFDMEFFTEFQLQRIERALEEQDETMQKM